MRAILSIAGALGAAMCVASTSVYYETPVYSGEYAIEQSEPVVETIYEDTMPLRKVKVMSPKKSKKAQKASQKAIKKHQMMKGMMTTSKAMSDSDSRRLLWINTDNYPVSEKMVKVTAIPSDEITMEDNEYTPKISMFQKRLYEDKYTTKPQFLLRKKYDDNSDLIARRLVQGGPKLDSSKPDMVVITSIEEPTESPVNEDRRKRFSGIRGKPETTEVDKKKWFEPDSTKSTFKKKYGSDEETPMEPETRRLMYVESDDTISTNSPHSPVAYNSEYVAKSIYDDVSSPEKVMVHEDTEVAIDKDNSRKYQKKQQKIIDNMLVKSEKEKNRMLKKKFKSSRKNSTTYSNYYVVRNLQNSPHAYNVPKSHKQYNLTAPSYSRQVPQYNPSKQTPHIYVDVDECDDDCCDDECYYNYKNEMAEEMSNLFTCEEMCQFIEQKKQMIDPSYDVDECCCCPDDKDCECTTPHVYVSSQIAPTIVHTPTTVGRLN